MRSDNWNTPKYIFDLLGEKFDLDVAAPKDGPRHVPCDKWYSEHGLDQDWFGFIWMNPPYGNQNIKRIWLREFFEYGHGIALMPDRTSAPWFQEYAPMANSLLFLSPKIKFEADDGSIGESPANGTVLMAAGVRAAMALSRAAKSGAGFLACPS